MSEIAKSTAGAGFPVVSILGIVFITLKLTGHIDWSWLWVLSPYWVPLLLFLGFAGCALFIICIASFLGVLLRRRK